MKKQKIKPHQRKSILTQTIENRPTLKTLSGDRFVMSFEHLDKSQGATFREWDDAGILSRAMDTLEGYCHAPLRAQTDEKFTIYGDFPPGNKTSFSHPVHVPEDAEWARLHITGDQCIAGHVVQNTFYLVFLDTNHSFWFSELKHT
jgi:hypothetical protein